MPLDFFIRLHFFDGNSRLSSKISGTFLSLNPEKLLQFFTTATTIKTPNSVQPSPIRFEERLPEREKIREQ